MEPTYRSMRGEPEGYVHPTEAESAAIIANLQRDLSSEDYDRVMNDASWFRIFHGKAQTIDTTAIMDDKPDCLTDEQWQRVDIQYRGFL